MRPRVQIKKLRPDAVVPAYMSEHAAGLDLSAAIAAPMVIQPGERTAIGTGLAFALPPGYEGQIRPRSGLARKHGITLVNSPGTLDADFRAELMVLVINHGAEPVRIQPGDRIAQIVIAPVVQAELVEVDELDTTARGAGGFGSTGR
ncbi:MAG: deoxyuridine 5-triphosphate nucleotidohydrolase [Myxococcales bacterium]|nr:deoxyuridine 5-triphosphate nucleotidohydrolase [Myxococcales bacterium]